MQKIDYEMKPLDQIVMHVTSGLRAMPRAHQKIAAGTVLPELHPSNTF
jgi:hypothetical protein